MRRWLVLAALWVAFPATVAHAQPVRDGKQLLSCPDPRSSTPTWAAIGTT